METSVCGCLVRLVRPGYYEPMDSWKMRIRGHYRDQPECWNKHLEGTAWLWKQRRA